MKLDSKKINTLLKVTLTVSILCLIIGFYLWVSFVAVPDIEYKPAEELREIQRETALNYPLGRFLLYFGWIGLGLSAAGLIWKSVREKNNQNNQKSKSYNNKICWRINH